MLAAALLLAACSSAGGEGPGTITLYNGQHVADDRRPGEGVRAGDRDHGQGAHRRRVGAGRPDRDRGAALARPTCSSPRTPRRSRSSSPSTCWPTCRPRPGPPPRPATTRAAGDWVGISARVSVLVYNPALIRPADLPTSVLQLADPRFKGEVALAPGETDFQPIVTSVLHANGRAATVTLVGGPQGQRGQPHLSGQRDDRGRGQQGPGRDGGDQPVLLVPAPGSEIGAASIHSALATFAPRDPGYVIDVSGAAVLASSQHRADADRFVAVPDHPQGPGDHRPRRQLSSTRSTPG